MPLRVRVEMSGDLPLCSYVTEINGDSWSVKLTRDSEGVWAEFLVYEGVLEQGITLVLKWGSKTKGEVTVL